MNILDTITSIKAFDWFAIGFIVVMFILGFAQGPIRRLLGVASIAFSFLLAANLRDSLGYFLAKYWTQWPPEYNLMLAFGALFVLFSVIAAILIQAFYKHAPLVARYPVVDELLGGALGILQALVIIGAGIVILDSYFQLDLKPGTEVQILHDVFNAVDGSETARIFRETLLPPFVALMGPLLPSDIHSLYPTG